MDFLLLIPVLLFSVVAHEVAHAWQALREGDPTARDLGRITLNPIAHLSPVGSLLVPLAIYYLLPGDFIFGWARPVPVNPANYRKPRAGDIRVSLAGIVANLCLAALFTAALAVWSATGAAALLGGAGSALGAMLRFGILINLVLAWINLMPVPPLDGSHVVRHLLPRPLAARYWAAGRYGAGLVLLTVVVFPGVFSAIVSPVFGLARWLVGLAG